MLSIGEIAQRSGTSRRMLRHWEELGLLRPAHVDPATGHRGYQASQVARARAIAELRALGFGLPEVGRLLADQVSAGTVQQLLRAQEQRLLDEISVASTRLHQVRHRLDSLATKERTIAMQLTQQHLPELHLFGAATTVLDETEIGPAVAELRHQLSPADDVAELAIICDGSEPGRIQVFVGHHQPGPGERLTVPGGPGVEVSFPSAPDDVADAWVLIDDRLALDGLRTANPYRQLVSAQGVTTLQAALAQLH